ncbi:papilin isoform X2 [Onthophagus taurus]|uniref:papilin isoform X2 n=1 Tax=Onthophagus taurus TaxID=166361 RepID=UPI000C203754|nr:papilin isoform X2 [Onthophagus taurus]
MGLFFGKPNMSPLLILLVYLTLSSHAKSHHVRHHRDRFKRQQGGQLYLPGSYVTDNDEPDAGPWLDWSSPSPCTRTCGGGVSTQERQCTSGYSCRGPMKRHFSCNTQDCPDLADFRSQQCSEYDAIPFEDVYYQWVPYTKSPQPCELNCMPRGERFYYRHKLQVIDGTRCNDESLDVCVDGECQPVGCDMMLGSSAKEDKCRVCGGDGSTCNTFTDLLDMQDLQAGYNDILLIPAGAVNIKVREIAPSDSYLAVRNTSGYYYLNGNWRIDFPRTIDFAGSKFHYDRYPQGFSAPDSITCLGPTEEALFIVLLFNQKDNVGVEYEYSTPKTIHHLEDPETYAWTFDQFTTCSASCGGGYQYRNVTCAGRMSLEEASANLCDVNNKPVESQRCGESPCDPMWVAKDWEKCSESCGENGVQTRKIYCEQIISGGVPSIVDDQQCTNIQKPPSQQPCNQGVICAEWHTGPWKPCNKLCGKGKETRKVTCFRKESDKIIALPDSDCTMTEKPVTEKECMLRPCEGVDWVTSEWSGCEDKCGLSEETRFVKCATASGDVYEDKLCEETEIKPAATRKCEKQAKGCEFEWHASQWSDCSAKCGGGIQTRKVVCVQETDDGFKKVDPNNCDEGKKYDESKNCTAKETVCPGEWFTGPWTECSEKCGGGVKARKVICMHGETVVTIKDCDVDATPLSTEECNKQLCDKQQPSSSSTEGIEISEAPAELSTLPEKEPTDRDVELVEDDYELVDDDICEDGEFVMIDDKEKYIEIGVAVESHVETKEATLSSDYIMMSDSTYVSHSSFSTDYGSGDYEYTKSTTGDLGSTAFDTSISEGSGDDTTYFKSSAGFTGTTEFEGSGSVFTDVSEALTTTLSWEITTVEPEGVSEISTEKETILSTIDEAETTTTHEVTAMTQESTKETDVSHEDDTTSVKSTDGTTTLKSTDGTTTLKSTDGTTTLKSTDETTPLKSTDETTTLKSTDATTTIKDSEEETTLSSISESETTEGITETTTIEVTQPTDVTTTEVESTTHETEQTTEKEITTTSKTDSTTPIEEETDDNIPVEVDPEDITEDTPKTTVSEKELETSTAMSEIPTSTDSDLTKATETETTIIETTGTTDHAQTTVSEATLKESESTLGSTESTTPQTKETETTLKESETSLGSTESVPTETSSDKVTSEEDVTDKTVTTESVGTETSVTSVVEGTDKTGKTEESSTVDTDKTTIETDGSEVTKESIGTDVTEELPSTTTITTEIPIVATTAMPRSTKPGIDEIFPTKPKQKMCKRRKKSHCKETEFGCCSDKVTAAKGPFNQGCPTHETCNETKYGCCEDGVSPAEGKGFKGCPDSQCSETLFGCCPDNRTPAEGNDNEGCPPLCASSPFGCCKDNTTQATGPNEKGCPEEKEDKEVTDPLSTTESLSTETTEESVDCNISEFGCCPDGVKIAQGENFKGCDIFKDDCNESLYKCCPDGVTSARGPNYKGCETECSKSTFGCCQDGITPAHGYLEEGCCLSSAYGCCPDNIKEAQGPNFRGCSCQNSPYGCCPDNTTSAKGPDNTGCGCQYTPHGCCPDNYTPATGANFTGCLCHTYQFGCCADGVTIAQGMYQQGCGCKDTEFGCCSDDETPAEGPNFEGCNCASSKFGCCLDGVSEAQGENFDGCKEIPENLQASCSQEKERGPCRNYTVKWFYDMQYGGCSRFWYGGCEGNGNRFKDKSECNTLCVEPKGKDRCKLPMVAGPCEGYYPQWYYDKERNHCAQFIYGGCLGNNNRFETVEECNNLCVKDRNIDACDQPLEEGPCRGNFYKWYFNKEESSCQPFRYGGCDGNNNNFDSELACKQKCDQAGRKKVKHTCHLPADLGNCSDYRERWYYDTTKKECRRFYYGGCGGNGNNFETEETCKAKCPEDTQPESTSVEPKVTTQEPRSEQTEHSEPFLSEFCFLPNEAGPCRQSEARWYYDRDGACKRFLYGGCEGNRNNFKTAEECEQKCDNVQDLCSLPKVVGPCNGEYNQWYYNQSTDMCEQFVYGGCTGNKNRFEDQLSCEQRCRRGPPTVTQEPPDAGPRESDIDLSTICYKPIDQGFSNCTDNIPAYYYEARTGKCLAFTYTGCGGNANRYNTAEQCERQCGTFRGQDVCSLPKDVGPCRALLPKFFFDTSIGQCAPFYYGGCEGNGNRFSTAEECQAICVAREEEKPEKPSSEICLLPAAIGNCQNGDHKRWFFDEARGECMVFIYSGCGGNFNRFTSLQECQETCQEYMTPVYHPHPPTHQEPTSMENPCQIYTDQCKKMDCPYGVKAYVDDNQCNRCKCDDPCEGFLCPDRSLCVVEVNLHKTDGNDANFIGVCREFNKSGECPPIPQHTNACDRECYTDAQCPSILKCCSNGCGTQCIRPIDDVTPPAELKTPSYQIPPITEIPSIPSHYYPPQIIESEFQPEITAGEGDYVMLRCAISGNPNPTISWKRGDLMIDGTEPRYRLTLDGAALQIISLYKTDSGLYLCTADNKIGRPLTKEIRLVVEDPVEGPARILDDPSLASVTVTLGSPATLNCYVYGYPSSAVAWFKDAELIPMKTEEFTINKDSSLFINAVRLRNLGIYTCQAYNGIGKASTWSVTVQALGPVYSTDANDKKYMKYVIDRPKKPDVTPHPMYPFRPNRPTVGFTPSTYRPVPTTTSIITTTTTTPRPRPRIVPVTANITLKDTKFPLNTDIHIPCNVDGYPLPHVQWYKDGGPIYPNDRIEITANYRLIIRKATESDSGEYRCEAKNEHSSATSTTPVLIRGQLIPANCTDNAFFANCKLIVTGKFCNHAYYAKFCCKSCTEAGQLNELQGDQPASLIDSNLV